MSFFRKKKEVSVCPACETKHKLGYQEGVTDTLLSVKNLVEAIANEKSKAKKGEMLNVFEWLLYTSIVIGCSKEQMRRFKHHIDSDGMYRGMK